MFELITHLSKLFKCLLWHRERKCGWLNDCACVRTWIVNTNAVALVSSTHSLFSGECVCVIKLMSFCHVWQSVETEGLIPTHMPAERQNMHSQNGFISDDYGILLLGIYHIQITTALVIITYIAYTTQWHTPNWFKSRQTLRTQTIKQNLLRICRFALMFHKCKKAKHFHFFLHLSF